MAKPKKCNYELIEGHAEPYRILERAMKWHDDVRDARIALAWRKQQKADQDGHLVLGRCVKISDLQKEMAEFDFVIVLNREVWESIEFTEEKKLALMDHELCHAAVSEDEDGSRKHDERLRPVFRVRKHDIEEFGAVVKRHGCYKRDLERFAELLLAKQKAPLLKDSERTPAHVQ